MLWRFIETPPLAGHLNMLIDEALLESHLLNETPPTLRFYQWEKPTLSLGRSQKLSEVNLEVLKKNDFAICQRPTGGKAVFHQGEFTYSFVSSTTYNMPENLFSAYIEISKAIMLGLKELQPMPLELGTEKNNTYAKSSFCFSASTISDLNYLGNKLVGSAQLRKKQALLQHGSILIKQDFLQLPSLFVNEVAVTNQINLSEILGFIPSYDALKKVLLKGFEEYFKISFETSELTSKEKEFVNNNTNKWKLDF